MKLQKFVFALLTVLTAAAFAVAQAPSWNHKSLVTFQRQTEIPGRIVPAGQYVLKLIVPENHVAQLLSTDETQVFGVFFTKPRNVSRQQAWAPTCSWSRGKKGRRAGTA